MQDPIQGKGPPHSRQSFSLRHAEIPAIDTYRKCALVVPLLNPVRLVKEIAHYIYIELKTHAHLVVGIYK